MSTTEAKEQFKEALKLGQKYVKTALAEGKKPYPPVLEQMVTETMIAGRRNIGLVEIPMELIVGTREAGRQNAFAGNFMPLLTEKTEFGRKWILLCAAHLGDSGITEPVQCFEYLGKFYVQEGNKRVSVLKSYDSLSISGTVTRLIPVWSEKPEVQAYYAFMKFYELSHLYHVQFTYPEGYARLQAALGFAPDHEWTAEERSAFLANYYRFREAFRSKNEKEEEKVELADALLKWLQLYSLNDLRAMTVQELSMSLDALWPDLVFAGQKKTATYSTEPSRIEDKSFLDRLFTSRLNHLNVAFVHAVDPSVSSWVSGHELGGAYLAKKMGTNVDICSYVVGEQGADETMERAVQEGAQLVIATSPSLIPASRKIAARYPQLRVMNCALSVPYTGIRTYYCRIYEAKFIAGAIAGLMAKPGEDVGYVANRPIFGVPAAINAYALGVRMTNPDAKVRLGWTGAEEEPVERLIEEGVRVISNRELSKQDTAHEGINWGTYRIEEDGSRTPLASPCWNWGRFYENTVQSILAGTWDPTDDDDAPITYWWGMDSRVIDVLFDQNLPDGAYHLGKLLRTSLNAGVLDVFHCRITDQNGVSRNDGKEYFTTEQIMKMDWLCDNVVGKIPSYEELKPGARRMVRSLGIYRDEIAPEKDD